MPILWYSKGIRLTLEGAGKDLKTESFCSSFGDTLNQ